MGVMPHLGDLIAGGISGDLRSTLPTNSAVAWPSFMTGRNAGKHGVFDFTLRVASDRTLLAPADSRSIRSGYTVTHRLRNDDVGRGWASRIVTGRGDRHLDARSR